MPWTLARDFATTTARLEREKLLSTATAMRAAQAEEKGWQGWAKALG